MRPIIHLFAGIAVSDYVRAAAWYQRLFARPPDMLPHDQEAVWHMTDGGSLYIVADRKRAGTGIVTLIVGDLDGLLTELAGRELTPASATGRAGELRQAMFTDPDGNRVTLGQLPTPHRTP